MLSTVFCTSLLDLHSVIILLRSFLWLVLTLSWTQLVFLSLCFTNCSFSWCPRRFDSLFMNLACISTHAKSRGSKLETHHTCASDFRTYPSMHIQVSCCLFGGFPCFLSISYIHWHTYRTVNLDRSTQRHKHYYTKWSYVTDNDIVTVRTKFYVTEKKGTL